MDNWLLYLFTNVSPSSDIDFFDYCWHGVGMLFVLFFFNICQPLSISTVWPQLLSGILIESVLLLRMLPYSFFVNFNAFRLVTLISPCKNWIISVVMKYSKMISIQFWLLVSIPDYNDKTSIPHSLLIHRSLFPYPSGCLRSPHPHSSLPYNRLFNPPRPRFTRCHTPTEKKHAISLISPCSLAASDRREYCSSSVDTP